MDLFKDVEEIKPDVQPGEEEPLHFYYNREERIAKAPPKVQEYYRGGMRPVKGFKVLFLKQNKFIFISLVLLVAFTWLYTGLNKTKNSATFNNVNFELKAFSNGEEVYVSIKMNRKKKNKEPFPVYLDADIFAIEENNQVCNKVSLPYVYNEGEEFLRTKFTDYDIMRVDVILKIGDEQKELSADVVKG